MSRILIDFAKETDLYFQFRPSHYTFFTQVFPVKRKKNRANLSLDSKERSLQRADATAVSLQIL